MTQTAWLLEWPGNDNMPSRYWNPDTGWMLDPRKGIWFAREQDAASYKATSRVVGEVKPSEHIFGLQLRPQEAPTIPPEGERVEQIARMIDPEGWSVREYNLKCEADRLAWNTMEGVRQAPGFRAAANEASADSLTKAQSIASLFAPLEAENARLREALKPFANFDLNGFDGIVLDVVPSRAENPAPRIEPILKQYFEVARQALGLRS